MKCSLFLSFGSSEVVHADMHLAAILGVVWRRRYALSKSDLQRSILSFGWWRRIWWMRVRKRCRANPYIVWGSFSSSTRWFIDRPCRFWFERSCVTLFFGILVPFSSMVIWCWSPSGYSSPCFILVMQSLVMGSAYPNATSCFTNLSTIGFASGVRADLWFPRSSCFVNSLILVRSGRSSAG